MRVCVHDIRRVHIWLDTACDNRKEKGEFIGKGEIGSKVGVRAIAFPVVH